MVIFMFFSSRISGAEQLDIPEPDALQEAYLQGNREEKRQQCSSEAASALGEKCSFCHNDNVTDFTEKETVQAAIDFLAEDEEEQCVALGGCIKGPHPRPGSSGLH